MKDILKNILLLVIPVTILVGGFSVNAMTLKSNEKNVAIVNEDLGTLYNEEAFNYGSQFSNSFTQNKDYTYSVVAKQTAVDGLSEGRYDFAIFIPMNFSEMVLNLSSTSPESVYLDVRVGDHITATDYDSVDVNVNKFNTLVNNSLNKIYFTSILGELYESKLTLQSAIVNEEDISTYITAHNDVLTALVTQFVQTYEYVNSYKEQVDSVIESNKLAVQANEELNAKVTASSSEVEEILKLLNTYNKDTTKINTEIAKDTDSSNEIAKDILEELSTLYMHNLRTLKFSYEFNSYLSNNVSPFMQDSFNLVDETREIYVTEREELRSEILSYMNADVEDTIVPEMPRGIRIIDESFVENSEIGECVIFPDDEELVEETKSKNPKYVENPEEPEVTDPEEPEVTDPEEPEVTDPEEPEVTDPEEPEVTDPEEPSTCNYVSLDEEYIEVINNRNALYNILGGRRVSQAKYYTGNVVYDKSINENFIEELEEFIMVQEKILNHYFGNKDNNITFRTLNTYEMVTNELYEYGVDDITVIGLIYNNDSLIINRLVNMSLPLVKNNFYEYAANDVLLGYEGNSYLSNNMVAIYKSVLISDFENILSRQYNNIVANALYLEKLYEDEVEVVDEESTNSDYRNSNTELVTNVSNFITGKDCNIIIPNDSDIDNNKECIDTKNYKMGVVSNYTKNYSKIENRWVNDEGIKENLGLLTTSINNLNVSADNVISDSFKIVIDNYTTISNGHIMIDDTLISLNKSTDFLNEQYSKTSETGNDLSTSYDTFVNKSNSLIDENVSFNSYYQSILDNAYVNGSVVEDFSDFLVMPTKVSGFEVKKYVDVLDTYIYLFVLIVVSVFNYFLVKNANFKLTKENSLKKSVNILIPFVLLYTLLEVMIMTMITLLFYNYLLSFVLIWAVLTFLVVSVLTFALLIIGYKRNFLAQVVIVLILTISLYQVINIDSKYVQDGIFTFNSKIIYGLDAISYGVYNTTFLVASIAILLLIIELFVINKHRE